MKAKRTTKEKDLLEPLTPQQILFAHAYVATMKATDAAEQAGYKRSRGARLLKDVRMERYVAILMEQRCVALDVTADKVLAGLLTEAQREGEGTSHSARVAAWSALGKAVGLFTDKLELSGSLATDGRVVVYLPDNSRDQKAE